ncbi:MAG: hypothetical protein KDJ87_09665 [Rhizobiaceae bacterium]|nr:hypothetical protein [Rhizobiaceae bacterium]
MAHRSQIVVDLDSDLKDAFYAAASADDRPVAEIVRGFIRDYVHDRETTPEYDAFVERKVTRARISLKAGKVSPNADVEARFAKMRAAIMSGDA